MIYSQWIISEMEQLYLVVNFLMSIVGKIVPFLIFLVVLNMIMHRPVLIIYYSIVIYYFAGVYNVPCTPVWLITGAVISIVLAVASPPVAGGGAVVYSMLFAQMGIPTEAIATALVINLITDFSVTAFEVGVLPMTLINVSSQMSMLNTKVLKKEE